MSEDIAVSLSMTERKRQGKEMLRRGEPVKTVAALLDISERTVYKWKEELRMGGVAPAAKVSKPKVSMVESAGTKKVSKPAPAPSTANRESDICSFCGKTLTRAKSIDQGCGDTCASKKLKLGGMSLADYRASLTQPEIPKGFIQLKEAFKAATIQGISVHRFLQVCGGDRAIDKPLLPCFQIVYVGNRRYISSECLKHMEEAKLR